MKRLPRVFLVQAVEAHLNSVARFVNMHARAGVAPEDMRVTVVVHGGAAKDVTTRRIYLQTMEEILEGMDKVLIDNSQGGSGVLPYLPLNELGRSREATQ